MALRRTTLRQITKHARTFIIGATASALIMAAMLLHLIDPEWRVLFSWTADGIIMVDLPAYFDALTVSYLLLNPPVVVLVERVGASVAASAGMSSLARSVFESVAMTILSPLWWLGVAYVVQRVQIVRRWRTHRHRAR